MCMDLMGSGRHIAANIGGFCMATKKKDWIEEAYKIARGKSKASAKLEHIMALTLALDQLQSKIYEIEKMMANFYQHAAEIRAAQGLPPLPPPPGIKQ